MRMVNLMGLVVHAQKEDMRLDMLQDNIHMRTQILLFHQMMGMIRCMLI